MKVLFLTPYLPSPPRFGGQRRLHGLMRELARNHEVWALSLVEGDVAEDLDATRAYCAGVVTVENDLVNATGIKKRLVQLASVPWPRSFEHVSYHSRAMQRALDELVAQERFDVVEVEFAQMASYRSSRSRARAMNVEREPVWVLDEHNIEYDIVRRTADADVGIVRRAYSALDWRKLRAEERTAWTTFDGCVLTSTRDEDLLRTDCPRARTSVVPNGVDIDSFVPPEGGDAATEPETVLFFGAINYYPNTEGLLHFLRETWPLLKARRPGVRLRIVGPKPPPQIAEWPDPAVEVKGYVDDIRAEIARARAVIAPLRIGGGTRLKVVEAMALGKAIVSTTLGAEGIDVTHDEHLLLADTPERFADDVARVLDDGPLRTRLGRAARQRAVDRYSWRAAAEALVRFYEELARDRR